MDENQFANEISILGVSIADYLYAEKLPGAENDLISLFELLVKSSETAIYEESQFKILSNPTTSEFRETMTEWVVDHALSKKILVFYFSGHALILPSGDLGFCFIDTRMMPDSELAVVTTLVPFSEILQSIASVKADPVFILDTCYSGKAGHEIENSFLKIKREIQAENGSTYILFASCKPHEQSLADERGSLFSQVLCDVSRRGKRALRKSLLMLTDLGSEIKFEIENAGQEIMPQFYIGPTMPQFPWVKNVLYIPRTERFTKYHVELLRYLWSSGHPQSKTTTEIRLNLTAGNYGNNRKLMLPPWDLIYCPGNSKSRALTKKGILFMEGKLTIPSAITKDDITGEWLPGVNARFLSIEDYPILQERLL